MKLTEINEESAAERLLLSLKSGNELRELLAHAAALAVKREREGAYSGAWPVADAVIAKGAV